MIKYVTGILFISLLFISCATQNKSSVKSKSLDTSKKNSQEKITNADIKTAQKLIGLDFHDDAIDTMKSYLDRNAAGYDSLRAYKIPIDIFPALALDIHPKGFVLPKGADTMIVQQNFGIERPKEAHEIAFLSIAELASLIRTGQLSSEELTRLYLTRLEKYNPILQCAITITKDLAIKQAKKADQEIAAGHYRGLLHGIPYGVKDLVSVKNYKTTWGAMPYKDQIIDHDATIIKKLEKAGAVLIAKLVSGALARGDVWFDGQTMNPWDTLQGASGSSAGSGSATSAGLVGFSIGTETLGSITSPSTRNGVTGLRPTYGRVSRDGVMSLSWSMDKVGPITRSAQDCAIVFDAIRGNDEHNFTTKATPFYFDGNIDHAKLRIACISDLIDQDTTESGDHLRSAIALMKNQGIKLHSISLPSEYPFDAFDVILRAEAATFFDELVRSGDVDMMVQQTTRSRANSLRQARFIPAVEYIQANRFRSMLIEEMHELMKSYDIVITPTIGGKQLMITNLTGHPVVTVPSGIDSEGHPTSISFLGQLYQDGTILSFANYFQQLTNHHIQRPPDFNK